MTDERMKPPETEVADGQGDGVCCPKCGCRHTRVVYVRHLEKRTMRRRECRNCGRRFLTYETTPGGGPDDEKS